MEKQINSRDVFEALAKDYIREDTHWGSDLDLIKASLDELIKTEPNPRWLDLGCGAGFHIAAMAELYPEVSIVGVDHSQQMLNAAKYKIKNLGLKNIALNNSDITKKFQEGKYHLITSLNNAFGNLYVSGTDQNEIRAGIAGKITDALCSKGCLILSVYNIEKFNEKSQYCSNVTVVENLSDLAKGDLIAEYRNKGKKVLYYTHWFSEGELRELAKETGLKIDFLERRMSRFLVRYKKD
ncbi:MAG: class I SAM-dependent methyltransferase [Candidatus Diapherotrites archaeon]|nr:class I SAM-dependent methyltransferase [Candidatus Diapherotrites archaeon]